MPQQEPWWKDEKYYDDYSFDGINVPIANVEAIVSEATRRGEENGKREAWEFYRDFIQSCYPEDEPRDYKYFAQPVRTPSHKETFLQGKQYMIRELLSQLSSLSQSSNEKV